MAGYNPVGNKTFLTKELIEQAYKYVAAGNYIKTVCDYLGIAQSTYYLWDSKAKRDKENGVTDSIYIEFMEAMKAAESEAEMRNVQYVQSSAAKGKTEDARWWLTHKKPENWADKTRIEHSGSVSMNISNLDVEKMPTELLNEIIKNNGSITDENIKKKLEQYQSSSPTTSSESGEGETQA